MPDDLTRELATALRLNAAMLKIAVKQGERLTEASKLNFGDGRSVTVKHALDMADSVLGKVNREEADNAPG